MRRSLFATEQQAEAAFSKAFDYFNDAYWPGAVLGNPSMYGPATIHIWLTNQKILAVLENILEELRGKSDAVEQPS